MLERFVKRISHDGEKSSQLKLKYRHSKIHATILEFPKKWLFECVSMDVLGPLKERQHCMQYILVIADRYSLKLAWLFVVIIPAGTEAMSIFFEHSYPKYKIMAILISGSKNKLWPASTIQYLVSSSGSLSKQMHTTHKLAAKSLEKMKVILRLRNCVFDDKRCCTSKWSCWCAVPACR